MPEIIFHLFIDIHPSNCFYQPFFFTFLVLPKEGITNQSRLGSFCHSDFYLGPGKLQNRNCYHELELRSSSESSVRRNSRERPAVLFRVSLASFESLLLLLE